MNKTLNFISIFGVLGFCIKFYFEGRITLGLAGGILIACVILCALDRPIWQFLKAAVAIISIGSLLVGYAYSMNDFISLLQPILTLVIALFGIYIIVKGFFGNMFGNNEETFIYNKRTGKLRKK